MRVPSLLSTRIHASDYTRTIYSVIPTLSTPITGALLTVHKEREERNILCVSELSADSVSVAGYPIYIYVESIYIEYTET